MIGQLYWQFQETLTFGQAFAMSGVLWPYQTIIFVIYLFQEVFLSGIFIFVK